ncbi:hypothetical protein ACQKWADRAFT_328104 [Trichoderma austrokoningii]
MSFSMLKRMRNALRRWAKRLFHRGNKKQPPDQPSSNKASSLPQQIPALTSTNATEQHTAPTWPLKKDSHQPYSTLDAQTTAHSQVASTSASNNQPQSLRRKPLGTRDGYLKPALKKAVNESPSESSHRKLPIPISDEHADGPNTTGLDTNNDRDRHHGRQVYVDHSIHPRPAVVHEEITPHVHTIYEPQRTLSFHLHEHRTLIQPIVDPAAR